MKVRQVEVSQSDVKSAQIFFKALTGFYDLKGAQVLDMFARTGVLTVDNYRREIYDGRLFLWELNEEHRQALEEFNPYELKIGCSYKSAEECNQKFDMIVIDTPQGVHTDHQGNLKYEHFDVIQNWVPELASETSCMVVVYVNKYPYDKNLVGSHGYDEYEQYNFNEWMTERTKFYGSKFIETGRALDSYNKWLQLAGFNVLESLVVPCYSDIEGRRNYAFRLGLLIERQ